ncbi:MAG: hypothetical protein GOV15_03260, partial [Candidatus Diapherotrites archaeon]|nr:hypothetical protein [Candidatus Diapherotrites archaeon]
DVPKPKQEFAANIEVNAKLLKEAFKDASLFSSSVVLRVDGDRLLIESQGAQGNLKTIVPSTHNIKVESTEEVISKYSLNFLSNILREADTGDIVKLSLKSEAPLKVTYPIGDAKISYYLAPMLL